MTGRNLISKRQTDTLKVEALRAYFDFREGRPTAEDVAEKLNLPVRTVREWLADNSNGELLDDIVPLWPNMAGARQFASEHVPEALQVLVELMRSAKSEKARLDAAMTLLALAGVRPVEGVNEEKPADREEKRPAVLLNLFLGGGQEPIQIVDGETREIVVEKPVRVAGETIQVLSEPGTDK